MILEAKKEYVFLYNTQAPSCHASTVLPLPNGTVLTAWFAGQREGADDVGIWASIRKDGQWSAPVRISEERDVAHWNPVLHLREDGKIILYYKYGQTIPNWITKYVISEDNGQTWSAPCELVDGDTEGGRGPVKNKCIRLQDGTVLAPASTEQNKMWIPFIDRSEDDGLTWEKQTPMERPKYRRMWVNMIQPTLWQSADQSVHCLLRTNQGAVYRSDSEDLGITWCKPYRTALPNNNSGLDLAQDSKGNLWLLYNPVSQNWGDRTPLTLAVSKDDGETFKDVINLEVNPGEYSYPAITCVDDKLYLTYTHLRERVAYWEITPEI